MPELLRYGISCSHNYILLDIGFEFFRYDDKYNLVLSCRDGKTGTLREASLVKSVANFFDENGTLIYEVLEPEISKLHNSLLSDRKEK
jgi:signal peptidase complex subunit 2